MRLLRSTLFAVIFYGGTVVAASLALLLALVSRPALQSHVIGWARFHRWCARNLLGVASRVEGPIPAGRVLFAAKHESMFETIEFLTLIGNVGIVLKQELADLPLWGRAAQAYGAVPVDREGSARALKAMVRRARELVAQDRSILIFPEGTRVAPGQSPPLRPGFAGLYRGLGLPVVPVALDSGRLWGRGTLLKWPGIVTFRFGEPIPPGLPRAEIEARVHAAINALQP